MRKPSKQLGYKDSNLEMTESESVALPFGDSPLSFVLCFFSVSLSDKMYYIAPLRKMQVFFSNFFKNFLNLFSGRFFRIFISTFFRRIPIPFPSHRFTLFFQNGILYKIDNCSVSSMISTKSACNICPVHRMYILTPNSYRSCRV